MSDTVTELAELLHERMCDDYPVCKRWASQLRVGDRHRGYYRERARVIYRALEPEIGSANVLLAARVITTEVV